MSASQPTARTKRVTRRQEHDALPARSTTSQPPRTPKKTLPTVSRTTTVDGNQLPPTDTSPSIFAHTFDSLYAPAPTDTETRQRNVEQNKEIDPPPPTNVATPQTERVIPAVQTDERDEATPTDPNTIQWKIHQKKIILTKTNHHIEFLTKCSDQQTIPTGLQIRKLPNITQMTDTFIIKVARCPTYARKAEFHLSQKKPNDLKT